MNTYDLFIEERVAQKRVGAEPLIRYRLQKVEAVDPDDLLVKITALKLRGNFRAYQANQAVVLRAFTTEAYVTERIQ